MCREVTPSAAGGVGGAGEQVQLQAERAAAVRAAVAQGVAVLRAALFH